MNDRLVRVLETFTSERTAQTVAEIGRRANLPSSTAHRIVGELVHAGLLDRDEAGRVRVGVRLWELATRSSGALRLRQAALPHMQSVQSRVGEHTQLAVLEQDEALFVERLSSAEAGANITRIAGRLPLHASSSGLVLLAFGDRDFQERVLGGRLTRHTRETIVDPAALRRLLADIRTRGHAIAPGYLDEVSTGVAVPITDNSGHTIAAVSVILGRDAATGSALAALYRCARDIEHALALRP